MKKIASVLSVVYCCLSFGLCQDACSSPSRFICADNTCITIARTCDGKNDCLGGEDEARCGPIAACKPRSMVTAFANHYSCRRPCNDSRDCRGIHKRCTCDDECGYSCLNPNAECPSRVPVVPNSVGHTVIRFNLGVQIPVPGWSPYIYGDMIRYICGPGTTLTGPLPRCNGRQQWSSGRPKCVGYGDPCMRNPCRNGGTCYAKGKGFTCSCRAGFSGYSCETMVACESLPSINNGDWNPDIRGLEGYPVYTELQPVCNYGFYPDDVTFPLCRSDGTWHPNYFECKKIECSSPERPEYGYVIDAKDKYQYEETAELACFEDYELVGNSTVMCVGDEDWTEGNATCIRHVCTLDPYLLPEGITVQGYTPLHLDRKKFLVDESATLACSSSGVPHSGEHPFQPPVIRCTLRGRWLPEYSDLYCGEEPELACRFPVLPEDVSLRSPESRAQFPIGTEINLRCTHNKILIGPDVITCQSDGTWSSMVKCEEKRCRVIHGSLGPGVEVSVGVGSLMDEDGTFGAGATLSLSCSETTKEPFLASLQTFINFTTCIKGGEWSPNIEGLICVGLCGEPPEEENGMLVLNNQGRLFHQGQTVAVDCPPNFRPTGSDRIQCLGDGTWSRAGGCELVACESLPSIINGDWNTDIRGLEGYPIYTELQPVCNYGFYPDDVTFPLCRSDGTWHPNNFECKKIGCSSPERPEYGYVIDEKDKYQYEETAELACFEDYELVGNSTVMCVGDYDWTDGNATCIRNVCNLDPYLLPEGITVQGYTPLHLDRKKFSVDESATLACSSSGVPYSGGHPFQPSVIRCTLRGRWLPEYSDLYCGEEPELACRFSVLPEDVLLRSLESRAQFPIGTEINLRCSQNKILIGPDVITCQSDGTWSSMVKCEEKRCRVIHGSLGPGVEVSVGVGSLMDEDGTFGAGATLSLSCSETTKGPFLASLQTFINFTTCIKGGEWSPIIEGLICVGLCGEPPEEENGMLVLNNQGRLFHQDQTIAVDCPPNFRPRGSDRIQCLGDGTWSRAGGCEPTGCWIDVSQVDESVVVAGHTNQSLIGVEFAVRHVLGIECSHESQVIENGLPNTISCLGESTWSTDYRQYKCSDAQTCEGRCLSREGPCACDFGCETRHDCCDDFVMLCQK